MIVTSSIYARIRHLNNLNFSYGCYGVYAFKLVRLMVPLIRGSARMVFVVLRAGRRAVARVALIERVRREEARVVLLTCNKISYTLLVL